MTSRAWVRPTARLVGALPQGSARDGDILGGDAEGFVAAEERDQEGDRLAGRGRVNLGRMDSYAYRKLDSSVALMEAADHGFGNDPTKPLAWSAFPRVLVQ
jgi:hypothetical protein